MFLRAATIILVISAARFAASADERLLLDTKINGKRARLCFDSGSEYAILFREAAQRLGLKVLEAPTNVPIAQGEVRAGVTERFLLNWDGDEHEVRFRVLDTPAYVDPDFDGMIGWRNVQGNVLKIDAASRKVAFLPEVPKKVSKWTRLPIATNSATFALEIPHTDGSVGILSVDTGSGEGVCLIPQQWQVWKTAHPQCPMTLTTFFTPADGLVVVKEAWATQISLGPLVFADVPLAQAAPVDVVSGTSRYEGTLGLAALNRFEPVVDRRKAVAYLHGKKTRPPPYQHNRLAAVFLPTATRTNQAVARVLDGGPAYDAGVRNGDVLLQVDGEKITSWSRSWLDRFGMRAGTKLNLTLDRDGKIFNATATLRDILAPSKDK